MQRHKKLRARILSLALSVAMVCTMLPTTVLAAEGDAAHGVSSIGNSGTIQSFDKLEDRFIQSVGENAPSHVYGLTVALDTPFEDLNLPAELTVMVERTTTVTAPTEDEPAQDSVAVEEPAEDETIPDEDIVVDEDASTDDTVSGNQPASPSDAKEEVKEEIKDKEAVVTTVERESVPVEWKSDKEYKSDVNGKFIYTAVLPENFTLADGVKLPQIYVMVGRQARMANTTKIIVGGDNASNSAELNGPYPATLEGLLYAFWEAGDGTTIQLGADISDDTGGSAYFSPSTQSTVTLDLNGQTIFSTGCTGGGMGVIGVMAAQENATLNIIDSAGGGKLIVDNYIAISATSLSNYTATLNISGGTISSIGSTAIYNDASNGGTANVNVSGGTISAPIAYVKYDDNGTYTTSLKITGGSIKGDLADGTGDALPIPKNDSNANVYLTTITLSGVTEETEVTAITGAGGYSVKGLSTDSSGKVYLWLPKNTVITAVTAGSTVYSGSITTTSNNAAAATFTSGSSITVGTQPTSPAAMTYGSVTGSLTVAGTASNNNAVSYQWYKNTTTSNSGGTAVTSATNSNFTIPTTLGAGTHYYYCVLKATDCADKASNVATVTVNKADYPGSTTASVSVKSDTANNAATATLPTPTTGASYGTVTVTTSNGLVSGTPTISGTTLTMNVASKAANTTEMLTVAISGGTNYNDATMTVTVTAVDKTPVTVTGLTAATGLTYTGSAQNGYTGALSVEGNKVPVNELVYTYTSTDSGTYNSSTAPTNTGAYKLAIKVADSNTSYIGAHADINFTISKKAVTVTADNKSIVIGAAKPTYTATADGLVSGQGISGVTFTDTATDTNTKGTFDITPSGGTITGGNDNYTITYTKGTLTITVATQVIDTAITNANAAKANISIFEGEPSTVTSGTKYVKSAEMKALTDAIAAAEAAKSTATTDAEAQAAATALDNAVATFKAAIKTGTHSGGSSGGGGGGGGSSSGGSSIPTPKPTAPVTGNSNTSATVDSKGNATVNVTTNNITDAVKAAQDAASKKGVNAGEVTAVINVTSPANSNPNTVTVNLPKTVQDQIISNKIGNVDIVIDKPDISIGMTLATITEMNKQANADIQLSATRTDATKLSTEAKSAIGSRPAFDLKATYASGSKSVTNFGSGTVSVAIPYTLQAGELAGGLYAVYIDENGKANYITGSSYDANAKMLRFSTNHFSVYGIGYKAPVGFTDIAGHWAETNIEFVANRGLMSGTSNTTFAPNGSMTRGMFVTALGRLAGVDTNSYKTGKFTDVKTDAYYAPYVNWAAEKGITSGTTATTFSPDNTVTRQEMAAFMSNYAKAMGYTVPETRAVVTFADNGSIGSWAAVAVKQMQMAGVLNGKNGNKFDPTGTATRAEVAAVLHRYVELVIDRVTAEGWTTNDSGSDMFYQSGKAVTGTQTISGVAYAFNTYGETTRKTTTAAPVTTPALPVEGQNYTTYTVKKGDSFWKIAHEHNCDMYELARMNGKTVSSIIYEGQVLKIPQK